MRLKAEKDEAARKKAKEELDAAMEANLKKEVTSRVTTITVWSQIHTYTCPY